MCCDGSSCLIGEEVGGGGEGWGGGEGARGEG